MAYSAIAIYMFGVHMSSKILKTKNYSRRVLSLYWAHTGFFRFSLRCIKNKMRSFLNILSVLQIIILRAVAVPPGFIDEGVTNVDAITGAFIANPQNGKPMLILSSKEGLIHVVPNPDDSDENILVGNFTSITCSNGERGLQTILPHPRFFTNLYIFVYYTRFIANCPESATKGPSNRLSRYKMNRNTFQIDMDSEVVLMTGAPATRIFHNGGSMAVANDGYLYITTGDVGSREPPYAQNLGNLQGKVLRLDLDGNVPPSNPFTMQSNGRGVPCRFTKGQLPPNSPADATCEEIYAYGLRNPFRMAMDPNTRDKVRFVIGDVGGSYWEEINEGGEDYVGTNYMWPSKCTNVHLEQ
jgi:glucose/arabinose dehydrogenase